MKTFHGGDIYSNTGIKLDFSVNTNPLGMPHFAKEAARESIDDCSRYPDVNCIKLKSELSAVYRVDEENIIVGNGAADIIYSVIHALNPKKGIIIDPAFGEYGAALESFGAQSLSFQTKEEDGFRLRSDEFMGWLKENVITSKDLSSETKIDTVLFLCDPNNPTGNVIEADDLEVILGLCEKNNIFVIVDECFLELCEPGRTVSAMDRVKEHMENLLILNAATKTYAMAGLRLGYGFCADKQLIEKINSVRQPWSVSIPAQAAGEALFASENEKERTEYLADSRKLIKNEREYLESSLKDLEFTVFDPDADFIFFKDNYDDRGAKLYDELLGRGILIRNCESYRGLDDTYYRTAVKCHEENKTLIEEIRHYTYTVK